jgi:hypothetical protein
LRDHDEGGQRERGQRGEQPIAQGPLSGAQQDDHGQQVHLDERPQVGVKAAPGARRDDADFDQVEEEGQPLVRPRVRGAQAEQRHDGERGEDGQLEEPQVVLVELMRIEVTEVAPERLQRRDERLPRVTAAVGEQRNAAGRRLHDRLPGHEDRGRPYPGQVVAAGPHQAAQEARGPHDGQGGHRDHDRFPGQRAAGEQDRGQHGTSGPHRE